MHQSGCLILELAGSLLQEIMRQLPEESMIYFGDTARVPYGTKSKDTIVRYSRQIVNFLLSKGVKAVVIACNTASALALADLQELYNVPIIGMVQPGAIAAMNATKNKNIGIIGTNATIKSGQYGQYLRKLDPSVTVVTKACPLFVPLVEEGLIDDRITEDMVSRYLREFKQYDIDSLILGCTHYPLLINPIQRFVGDKVTLVNPAYEVAKTLKQMSHREIWRHQKIILRSMNIMSVIWRISFIICRQSTSMPCGSGTAGRY